MTPKPALPAALTAALRPALGAVLLAAGCGAASAQSAAALRAGTTGLGAEFTFALTDGIGLRAGYHGGSVNHGATASDIRYEGKWKFGTGIALLDFHPGAGSFRLSLGLAYNGNRFDGRSRGDSGSVKLGGTRYDLVDLGHIDGALRFRRISPYVGIGWGRVAGRAAAKGLFFSADLGAIIGIDPRVRLRADCVPAITAAQCDALQASLRDEEESVREDLPLHNLYPVLSIGIGYRF